MNNLLSYCGLTDSTMRASDIDLPVMRTKMFCTVLKPNLAIKKFKKEWDYRHIQPNVFSNLMIKFPRIVVKNIQVG